MTESWEDFLTKVEVPSPGDAVIKAAATFFKDKLQIAHPALAEGYAEDQIAGSFQLSYQCKLELKGLYELWRLWLRHVEWLRPLELPQQQRVCRQPLLTT